MKAIAEALGRGLKLPVVSIKPKETEAHFGWLARFAGHDMPSSSAITQHKLNWKPTGPGLIADLDGMDYTQSLNPPGAPAAPPGVPMRLASIGLIKL
jgi:hypothetical protein